jgi:chromosome partitioning protein
VDTYQPVVLGNPNCAGGKAFIQFGLEFMEKLNAIARVNEPPSKFALSNLDD